MSNLPRHGTLELEEDLRFQRREWAVQRVGYWLMGAVLLAAVLGIFGNGPLSRAVVKGDGVAIRYERFWRVDAPTELRIDFAAGTAREGKVRLWIDRQWIESVDIDDIEPQPERVETGADRFTYVFAAADASQPGGAIIHFEPQEVGSRVGRAGIGEGAEVRFAQFIYP